MTTLTAKQQQVLSLAADGASNAEIAATLGVHLDTVKSRLRATFRAYGVNNRAAAVLCAVEQGDITVDVSQGRVMPSNIRQSQHGAVAVHEPQPGIPTPWKVVTAAGPYTFMQRLGPRDVADWDVLYIHHRKDYSHA